MKILSTAIAIVAVLAAPVTTSLFLAPAAAGPAWLPTTAALADIPGPMLLLYQQAAAVRCPPAPPSAPDGLPWPVLAAVGKVETDHGRNVAVSSAGARGPMQFMPATWAAYGVDGDGDGIADIMNPADAVHGAAHYLCASGAGNSVSLRDAIFAYNHATWYVDLVLEHAARYAVLATAIAGADVQALLASPRLVLTPAARADLANGLIDPRLVALLGAATQRHVIYISVFKTGHTKYVAGTRTVSNHYCGQAADIFAVDGDSVRASSPSARAFTEWLASIVSAPPEMIPGPLRPSEVGSPWGDLDLPGFFTNAAHADHVHLGFGPRCADV